MTITILWKKYPLWYRYFAQNLYPIQCSILFAKKYPIRYRYFFDTLAEKNAPVSSYKKCARITTKMWPKIICIWFLINVWSNFHALSCLIEKWRTYTVHSTGLKVSEWDWNVDFFPMRYRYFEIFFRYSKISIRYFSDTIPIRYC